MTPDITPPPVTKRMKITVSMDGLRRNLASSYGDLVSMLNYTFRKNLPIDWQELADKLLSLRQDIGILHCVYSPDEEEFSNLSSETSKMPEITFATQSDDE